MNEYAPAAIHWLANGIIARVPSAELSGIVGDPSHTYGYHRARNVLPSGDYSVQTSPDKQGDGWAASALDIKMNSTQMKLVTKRLLASAKSSSDSRLNALREFFGTTDGSSVAGWDVYYDRAAYSDDTSHTWHVHLSILRKYANSKTALAGVLEVFTGEDMPLDRDDVKRIFTTDGLLDAPNTWKETNPDENPYWTLNTYMMSIRDNIIFARREADDNAQAILDALGKTASDADLAAALLASLTEALGPEVDPEKISKAVDRAIASLKPDPEIDPEPEPEPEPEPV